MVIFYPLVNKYSCGQSPFSMETTHCQMAIFNGYVKLPASNISILVELANVSVNRKNPDSLQYVMSR